MRADAIVIFLHACHFDYHYLMLLQISAAAAIRPRAPLIATPMMLSLAFALMPLSLLRFLSMLRFATPPADDYASSR